MCLFVRVDWECCQVVYSVGIKVNEERVDELINGSLMLVMSLYLHIGYDKASTIAKLAHKKVLKLKEGAMKSIFLMV